MSKNEAVEKKVPGKKRKWTTSREREKKSFYFFPTKSFFEEKKNVTYFLDKRHLIWSLWKKLYSLKPGFRCLNKLSLLASIRQVADLILCLYDAKS